MCAADEKAFFSYAIIKGSIQNDDIKTGMTLNRCNSLKTSLEEGPRRLRATVPTANREWNLRRNTRRANVHSGPLVKTRPGIKYTAECKVSSESLLKLLLMLRNRLKALKDLSDVLLL